MHKPPVHLLVLKSIVFSLIHEICTA